MDFKGKARKTDFTPFLRREPFNRIGFILDGVAFQVGSQVIPCRKWRLEIDRTYRWCNSLKKSKEFAASVAKAFTLEGGVEIEEKVDLSTFLANFLIFCYSKEGYHFTTISARSSRLRITFRWNGRMILGSPVLVREMGTDSSVNLLRWVEEEYCIKHVDACLQ